MFLELPNCLTAVVIIHSNFIKQNACSFLRSQKRKLWESVPLLHPFLNLSHFFSFLEKDKSSTQSVNLPINQSINQSTCQSINQSINLWINQSVNLPINQSVNLPINQSVDQSISHFANQSVSEPYN